MCFSLGDVLLRFVRFDSSAFPLYCSFFSSRFVRFVRFWPNPNPSRRSIRFIDRIASIRLRFCGFIFSSPFFFPLFFLVLFFVCLFFLLTGKAIVRSELCSFDWWEQIGRSSIVKSRRFLYNPHYFDGSSSPETSSINLSVFWHIFSLRHGTSHSLSFCFYRSSLLSLSLSPRYVTVFGIFRCICSRLLASYIKKIDEI